MTIGFVALAMAALAIPHPFTAKLDDKEKPGFDLVGCLRSLPIARAGISKEPSFGRISTDPGR
jgi:hypothetical protein